MISFRKILLLCSGLFLGSAAHASFDVLPNDLITTIIVRAEPSINLTTYSLVSKKWREACASNVLWMELSKKYFPMDQEFYKANSATARKILSREHTRAIKIGLRIATKYPTFKLMVIWRLSIAKDLVKKSKRLVQGSGNDELIDRCLVASEFLGDETTFALHLSDSILRKTIQDADVGVKQKSVKELLDKYIALGSKHALEQKKLHQDEGAIE